MNETTLYLKKDSTLDFKEARVYNDFKKSYTEIVQSIIEQRKNKKITQEELSYSAKIDRRRIIKFERIDRVDMELLYFLSNKFSIKITFKNTL